MRISSIRDSSSSAICSRSRRHPPTSRRPRRLCPASACRIRISPAPSRRCCGRSRSIPGVTDVYGDVARSTYHSLQLTVEKRRSDDGLIVNFNYTFSRTEGQSRGADRLQLRPGLGGRRQRSAARLERDWSSTTCRSARKGAGQRQSGRARDRQGLAGLGHHAVPIRPSARIDWRRVQSAERRNVLRRFQPRLHRCGPHQRRLRRR